MSDRRIDSPPAVGSRHFAAPIRRRWFLVAVALLSLGVTACGRVSHPTNVDSEGVYVDAGPLTYQVQLSRELNPFNVEDKQYLAGVSAPPPRPDQMWFGVFMWAKNEQDSNHTTTDRFAIVDTQGNRYYPVAIDSQVNPFAWTSMTLRPLGTEPEPDSPAYFSATQGGLVLFKLDNTVYSNRPLTLEIYAPGQAQPSTVSLDL
jgi:hypothetical protein